MKSFSPVILRDSVFYIFAALFLFLSAGRPYCQNIRESEKSYITENDQQVSLYIHAGRMAGEANEYVMDGDNVLSRLIWKIDELYLAGGGIKWAPSSAVVLQADLWLKAADGLSTMDDYDWLISGADWTHWSHHDDTTVTKAAIFDFSLKYTPSEMRDSIFRLKPVIGYRFTDFEWQARGGSFIYTSDPDNISTFRDTEGEFPDGVLGITYEQIFHTPYAGFEIEIPAGLFYLTAEFTGSFLVMGQAVDHHHLRDLVTTAYFFQGDMFSVDITGGINLTKNTALTGSYSYMNYLNIRGHSAYDQSGTVVVYEDIEKADFESSMFSVSVIYSY